MGEGMNARYQAAQLRLNAYLPVLRAARGPRQRALVKRRIRLLESARDAALR